MENAVTKQSIEERINGAIHNGATGGASLAELIEETEAVRSGFESRKSTMLSARSSPSSIEGEPMTTKQTLEIKTYGRKCRETGN
jgi:hypothetical protein